MSLRLPAALTLCSIVLFAGAVHGYLKLGADVGGKVVSLHWSAQPVRYFVTDRDAGAVRAADLQAAVGRGFATWGAEPAVSISAQFVGFTSAEPFTDDAATVIGFRARPDLSRTLAATTFVFDEPTGEILESDIFFNSAFSWSAQPAGEASKYDVGSIAVHEIGHLLGLSHSALGETEVVEGDRRAVLALGAVMFPIAYPPGNTLGRTLRADDVAGMTDLYGRPEVRGQLGSLSGRVTLNGAGVFGAHVTAFNSATGQTIGSFSLAPSGEFVIAGLARGLYIVRAEPLDDADLDSFFEDPSLVATGFRPAYASRLAVVPAGGAGSRLEIRVSPK
jgi:hypothetical protein